MGIFVTVFTYVAIVLSNAISVHKRHLCFFFQMNTATIVDFYRFQYWNAEIKNISAENTKNNSIVWILKFKWIVLVMHESWFGNQWNFSFQWIWWKSSWKIVINA